MVAAAVLIGMMIPVRHEVPVAHKQYQLTWTTAPKPLETPHNLKTPPKMARIVVPQVRPPETPKIPPPVVAQLEVPKIRPPAPRIIIPQPVLPAAPAVLPSAVASPAPKPKEQAVVHTGTFGGSPLPVTTRRPADQVQTGGFGSPQGLPGHALGGSAGNVPKLGSFGLPEGPGVGNGTGGSHGVQGVVASAGFGNGVAGGGNVHGNGGNSDPAVNMGGFEKMRQVAAPSSVETHAPPPPADFQPIEILSKPAPTYTAEARELGIQGDVALSVVFEANGGIKVLGVVRSLGHGLDQAAKQAATKIRFKPALRAGQPTDFPATLRIEFRLADQST
jgi:protein TonB